MNHLTKRCGCGAIFALPNLKSRESRCSTCLRPAPAFGPSQVQHGLTCLFLFAGELSARGAKRRMDKAYDRANRHFKGATISVPTWADLYEDDVMVVIERSRPMGISYSVNFVSCSRPVQHFTSLDQADTQALDWFARRAGLIRGPGETNETLRDRVRLYEQNAYELAAR